MLPVYGKHRVQKGSLKVVRRTTKAGLVIGIMVLVMAFAGAAYAKLVVLSFTFPNDTQGFTASIQGGGATCNATVTTSWDSVNNALELTLPAASGCSGASITFAKVVVLKAGISIPSTDMLVNDSDSMLNLGSGTTSLGATGSAGLAVGSSQSGGNWGVTSATWSGGSNSGSQTLQYVLPLRQGQWGITRVIRITNVNVYSGN